MIIPFFSLLAWAWSLPLRIVANKERRLTKVANECFFFQKSIKNQRKRLADKKELPDNNN
jgi:hypothetical protein